MAENFFKVEGFLNVKERVRLAREKLLSLEAGEWAEKLWALASEAKTRVSDLTPKMTGTHARGWRLTRSREGKGTGFLAIVFNQYEEEDPPILLFLEYGTKAHTIEPIASWPAMLHFKTKDGKWVQTRLVHHKGTKPYAMIAITKQEFFPRLESVSVRFAEELSVMWREGKR